MKRIYVTLSALLIAVAWSPAGLAQSAKYVGTKLCSACHKAGKGGDAYVVWQKSKHSRAYETLLTDAANKIAKERGLTKPAAESPECLKCHVAGGGTAKNVEASFKMEEGVTCEVCHGAASGYKTLHVKPENKEKAIAAGLVPGSKEDAKACMQCHNEESPNYKPFKMAENWAKIAHPLPKK